MLCKVQVLEIYKLKISFIESHLSVSRAGTCEQWMRGKNIPVARRYGVSPRAIRDIWNRKTWVFATQELWPLENHSYANRTERSVLEPAQVSFWNLCLFWNNSILTYGVQVRLFYILPGRPKGSIDSKFANDSHRHMQPTSEVTEDDLNQRNGNPETFPQWLNQLQGDFRDPFHADWPFW